MNNITILLILLLGVIQCSPQNQLKSEKNDTVAVQANDSNEKLKDIEELNKLRTDYKKALEKMETLKSGDAVKQKKMKVIIVNFLMIQFENTLNEKISSSNESILSLKSTIEMIKSEPDPDSLFIKFNEQRSTVSKLLDNSIKSLESK